MFVCNGILLIMNLPDETFVTRKINYGSSCYCKGKQDCLYLGTSQRDWDMLKIM
jgi:GDP-D-mannose dehydratase